MVSLMLSDSLTPPGGGARANGGTLQAGGCTSLSTTLCLGAVTPKRKYVETLDVMKAPPNSAGETLCAVVGWQRQKPQVKRIGGDEMDGLCGSLWGEDSRASS